MASVSVTKFIPVPPEKGWAALLDLSRWDEWLKMHVKWKSELPESPGQGTQITQVISVMGMANKIEWTVEEFEELSHVRITGTGMAGVKVDISFGVEPEGEGTQATIDASFNGAMIVGPIGKAVAKHAQADLDESIEKFSELVS
ncbi:type II toxin-antitoxin system Rv0910 family toxin [Hoyosella subflava]|uniref:Polyketide cyclase/dehydrase n=1 Tax=Hoyosella subflava (strain DSM 45089 / JCM 17490 / NBRC 109087 / DQS3-9A1) TaxID=443218 RepID=F6EIE2_HOYSD|nr:SRPBCC family protein [Hoyosella subflava]AEF42434.1 hypothetical protein AS9A_4000 [Hoyosella subflava DQS3-9A1]